jgi:glutamyl-tRNA synthetase
VLADVRDALAEENGLDEAAVRVRLESVVSRRELKPREVYQPLRVALTGGTISPGIFESVALLGREETLRRIDSALAA